MENQFKYIEVIEFETGECVKRLDVTGKPESSIVRIELGLMRNMNLESYFTQEKEYDKEQAIS